MDRANIINSTVLTHTLEKIRIALEVYPGNRQRAQAVLDYHFRFLDGDSDDDDDSTPLELAGVDGSIADSLCDCGILSVEQLITRSAADLLALERIGPDSVAHIVEVLGSHGLKLRAA